MKSIHKYLMLVIACMLTTSLSATYYIAGNGTDDPNGNWCNGSNWGFQALDENNSITFYGVAAGKNYGFKITDAADWGHNQYTTFDYDNSDQPLYGGNGDDMGFTLTEDADVTISFMDNKVCVRATKALAYRSNYYYISGNASAMGNWSENAVALTNDQITLSNLAADWYEFKITNGTWDKTWGYPELDVAKSSPMHKTYGGGTNICFRLQAAVDVTVKMEKGKVVLLIDREYCVTGIGSWDAITDKTLTQENSYTYTFYNLSSGDYKFKVKESANGWNSDCTWGYDHLDTDNSNTGGDWDGDDHNIGFHLDAPADVTIALVNNQIRLNTKQVYFVTGELGSNGWVPADAGRRLDSETNDITFSNVAAGTYKLMITNGTWGVKLNYNNVDKTTSSNGVFDNGGDDHNIMISLDQTADVTIALDPSTSKITITSSVGYFSCSKYSVTGWGMFASDWGANDTETEMTAMGDGTYQYVLRDKYLTARNYGYRVIGDHSWDVQYPISLVDNSVVTIPETGTYTIVFSLNPVDEEPTYVAYLQHDVTISAYGYSTFYSDKAYIVPDGLTATIFTEVNGTALIGQSIDLIPAYTGVLLSGTANTTYALLQTTTGVTYNDNLFKGTTSDETIADNGKVHYILGLHDGQCGLYWPYGTTDGIGAFDNKAGKAYLELGANAAPARVRGFALEGRNVATAVEDVVVEADNAFYDLLGRKVTAPQPGNVYICNGKKVVIF